MNLVVFKMSHLITSRRVRLSSLMTPHSLDAEHLSVWVQPCKCHTSKVELNCTSIFDPPRNINGGHFLKLATGVS